MCKSVPPRVFLERPFGSILQKTEAEVIARNIMVIRKRLKLGWKELKWETYKEERLKDGHFSEWKEKPYFKQVYDHCSNPVKASRFARRWTEAYDNYEPSAIKRAIRFVVQRLANARQAIQSLSVGKWKLFGNASSSDR